MSLKSYQYNFRLRKFVVDHGCLDCCNFAICNEKCVNEKFICPIDKGCGSAYNRWVVDNFDELMDVEEEPSKQQWSEASQIADLQGVAFKVNFPKNCKYLSQFCAAHTDGRFTAAELRSLLVRLYRIRRRDGYGDLQKLADKLLDVLVPIDKQLLFIQTTKGDIRWTKWKNVITQPD